MAIDQRDITSQLRMMDDRALQQYAAMHKSDPYVFPLAFQESQNRQKLRMSGQARMAGQEQPKVNEAALMAMTPEAQGISGLPAPNMQRMADGGIAGYDDEEGMATGGMGGMFNFAQQSEPVVRMSGGGVPGYRGPTDGEDSNQVTDEFAGVDDQIAANMERQKMMGAFDDYSKPIPKPKKGSKADKKEEETKKAELPALATYTPKTAEEIKTASNTMAKPELEEIQKGYKPFAEQFAQDRSRIEGREKNAVSDALIRAGLATMAGKSQFAMQNIGEGGLQGLNAYQEGQKANEASRRALTQSEMLMTQAQRAEERGARSEAMSLYAQAEKSQQAGVQLGQEARKIENTDAYQKGSLLVQNRQADASMVSALAARDRANALNKAGGTKGALTEAQLAAVRDRARDNITKDANYALKELQAKQAAKAAGKPFDAATWLNDLVDTEVERMLANTSRASTIQPAPTGGKLGSGTFNIGSGWGQPEVVTPKK
tara:strand:- start:786 stop:2249 length:1464 start_codon:yes stop_codon:yes gene_type:complete